MKVVKRVIVGVLVAALAAGGIYTGAYACERIQGNRGAGNQRQQSSDGLVFGEQHWMEPSPRMFLRM